MRRILFQASALVVLFVMIWAGLSQVNWMGLLRVQTVTDTTERKLGELLWEVFSHREEEIDHPDAVEAFDSLVTRICANNGIDREKMKVHLLRKSEVNAFALPGGHLVVFSGLVGAAENEAELLGVLGHEMAHLELNHVMKKLVKEVGLSVLISMTTGNSGSEVILETARMLSSSAFDRKLEKEADLTAVDYLMNASIDPRPFADFLYRLSTDEHRLSRSLSWFGSHPDSKARAEYILSHVEGRDLVHRPVLGSDGWERLKMMMGEDD